MRTPGRAPLRRALRRYIDAGEYPINDLVPFTTPIFVDPRGRRCAVAALLEATGEHALVERIARDRNLAYVHELADDPELARWLEEHGLSLEEAARIQPAYHAHLEAEWAPTVSVIAAAEGGSSAAGAEALFAFGGRAGIRRNVGGTDDNGTCRFGSLALVAEYTRAVVTKRGGTNQLGAVLQWEPTSNRNDAQWYVLGGALASIDTDRRPGSGIGFELGGGFSFRRRTVPLFAEIVFQALPSGDVPSVHGGLQLGVVF